jgi:hypothetical protein
MITFRREARIDTDATSVGEQVARMKIGAAILFPPAVDSDRHAGGNDALKKGLGIAPYSGGWRTSGSIKMMYPKDVDALLRQDAYREQAKKFEACGALTLANASVAVPFVGAAVGALTVAQVIRLASMQATVQIMQMELGSPGMAMFGAMNGALSAGFGSVTVRFA